PPRREPARGRSAGRRRQGPHPRDRHRAPAAVAVGQARRGPDPAQPRARGPAGGLRGRRRPRRPARPGPERRRLLERGAGGDRGARGGGGRARGGGGARDGGGRGGGLSPRATARVPFVGLTGGLGAGKSTALAALERLGAATISSDAVVHELYGSDDVRDAVTARWGPEAAPD